jgi:hypothetical protein
MSRGSGYRHQAHGGVTISLAAFFDAVLEKGGELLTTLRLTLAIPLAIQSLPRSGPGCNQADSRPDATCGDATREHRPDGASLTSNP